MLIRFIRKHTKIILIVILSMMVVPFLFWGIGSIGKQGLEKKEPLRIKGKAISATDLREAMLDSHIFLLSNFIEGNNIKTPEQFEMYKDWFNKMISQIDFNKIAIQQLILQNEAKEYRISVSKDELAKWIEGFPLFQRNGAFDIEVYNAIVTNYFHTWPNRFEKGITRILTVKKLQKFLMDSVLISQKEVFNAYKEKNEKAEVYYVEFNTADYKNKAGEIDESELKDYYDKHKEEFRETEKIRIIYLLFDPANFKENIEVSQKEIEDYYETNKEEFYTGAEKDKKLKSFDEAKEEIKQKLAKQKQEDICQEKALEISIELTKEKRLGDMMKLANEKGLTINETDYLSREQGFIPELGWAPQFIQTAWDMELESVSDLLHIGDKWVIISPKEKRPSGIPEFQGVKDRIKDILKNKKAEELANQSAEETFKNLPKNLLFTNAVKSLGLKPKKSKPITKDNELFSLETKTVKTSKGTVLVTLRKFYPIDEKKWEKEKEEFTKNYLEEKKRRFFQQWLANVTKPR